MKKRTSISIDEKILEKFLKQYKGSLSSFIQNAMELALQDQKIYIQILLKTIGVK